MDCHDDAGMPLEQVTKQSVLEKLLELGMVMVTLDARCDQVEVPPDLSQDPQLRLNLSLKFGQPMEMDAWGIDARLTFGGVPFDCRLPWSSIYVIFSHANGQPYVFPEDVPEEVLAEVTQAAVKADASWDAPASSNRPELTVLRDEESDGGQGDESPDKEFASEGESAPEPNGGRRRGHLRVVK